MVTLTEMQASTLEYIESLVPVGDWFELDVNKAMKAMGLWPDRRNTCNHRIDKLVRAGVIELCPQKIECRVLVPLRDCKVKRHETADTMIVEYDGETISLIDLCHRHGMDVDMVWRRVTKYRWSLGRALKPRKDKKPERPAKKLIRYAGYDAGSRPWG